MKAFTFSTTLAVLSLAACALTYQAMSAIRPFPLAVLSGELIGL